MDKKRFYHQVLGPFFWFMERSAEDVCVQADFNDVIPLATSAATAAYHFHEVVCREAGAGSTPPMSNPQAEEMRQRLSDVVDTSKHGVLHNSDRQTSFQSALAFEFNQKNQFRYLRTEILAENGRFGEFDVAKTLGEFINGLGKEHDVELLVDIKMPKRPFKTRAEIFVTNKSVFLPNSIIVKMYRRDDNDDLILSDTPFELSVTQAS